MSLRHVLTRAPICMATVVSINRPPAIAVAFRYSSTTSSVSASSSPSPTVLPLGGRVAVVAGGSGGIGKSIAHELALRGATIAGMSSIYLVTLPC
jgi:hypothetical protein